MSETKKLNTWDTFNNGIDIDGDGMYRIGRQIRMNEPLHSGNVEYCSGIFSDEATANVITDVLNSMNILGLDDATQFVKNYLAKQESSEQVTEAIDDLPPLEMAEAEIMPDSYGKAVKLDKHIKAHAQLAQESLYEVCKGLKEMRDGKLYKELGYENFAEYCENEVGIKRRQAYNYISVAEKLTEDFVQSTAQIGKEKLFLLAGLDAPDREQLQQETDIESTTVKELKEKIKGMKHQHNLELDKAKEKTKSLVGHITELEKQIQELEERPVEVMQSTAELEEIERLKSELQEVKAREREAKVEAERIQNTSDEVMAESEKQIKEMQERISELENQSVPGAEPDTKELFRPYFQACTHSIGLMMDFISKQKESPDFAFLTSKASQIAELIENQLQDLKNN